MAHAAQHNLAAHTNAPHPSGGVPAYQYVAPGMFTESLKITVWAGNNGFVCGDPLMTVAGSWSRHQIVQFSDGTRILHMSTVEGDRLMRQYVRERMPHCPLVLGTWRSEPMGSDWVWRFHGEGGVIEAR